MRISYGITVCDENDELERLLHHMESLLEENDEIIILRDLNKTNSEVTKIVNKYKDILKSQIIVIESRLNNDFASFKNNLIEKANGNFLFQIDADEVPNYFLIENIKQILKINQNIDCFYIPRVNTVSNITQEHINKWGWRVDEQNRVNFPDFQMRLFKLNGNIKWVNKVHEILEGYKTISTLPYDTEDFCLYHHKTIEKQELQNKFYQTI